MTDISIPPDRPVEHAASRAWWFVFSRRRLLVKTAQDDRDKTAIPLGEGLDAWGLKALRQQLPVGMLHGHPCYAVEVSDKTEALPGTAFRGLRSLYGLVEEDFFRVALTAVHIVEWDKTSQFCGRCGASLAVHGKERAKECVKCGLLVFPRISPAVIVLIEREGRVLLGRSARFSEGVYSVLAGFVEPGESLEETVSREVEEETGIIVKDIRYFGSQPWPFPDSLMVGFTARYGGGEIHIDGKEIVDAGWFDADNLPEIPGKISIARRLIDWFVEKRSHTGLSSAPPPSPSAR
ncbi:MAG: NAD(+) diphosphatase [Syntrophorhabdales bacterium]|jgi:NAD+ diphosphatase